MIIIIVTLASPISPDHGPSTVELLRVPVIYKELQGSSSSTNPTHTDTVALMHDGLDTHPCYIGLSFFI
jgi:hypothetical protein